MRPWRGGFLRTNLWQLLLAFALASPLAGCHALSPGNGGGTAEFTPPRVVQPRDVLLPPGYRIEVVTTGLTFPTGIAFDGAGRAHAVEAG